MRYTFYKEKLNKYDRAIRAAKMYDCSTMLPYLHQDRCFKPHQTGLRILLGTPGAIVKLCLLFPVGIIGCQAPPDSAGSSNQSSVNVRVEVARIGKVLDSVDGLGRVEAIPSRLAILTPAVEGHVARLLVRQGEPVRAGQPIVELDRSAATADLTEKIAARDALRAALVLLKSLPRREEIRSQELAIEQTKVAVERVRASLENLEGLRNGGGNLASKQQIYDARKALEAAEFQHQAAVATLDAMMIGPRPEAVAEAEAKIKTADALVDLSRVRLEFHTIHAPVDGILDSLTCHPGQTIAVGMPVGEVVDINEVYATVWLAPRHVAGIRPGLSARVASIGSNLAKSSGHSNAIAGIVDFVGRIADPQTGNIPVRVLVQNRDAQLVLGQTVEVQIDLGNATESLQVPAVAVLDVGNGPIIEVVRNGKTAILPATVGAARDGWCAVSSMDLHAGELVIVDGGYGLPEGTPVNVMQDDDKRDLSQVQKRR
jgi:multidrug efflux pump subunit AcrA (membrane-fusion protein)